ncbi:ORF6N domain-containing protein [Pedobacter sandarakinus]|uniref:ORF6N domain-containing protein n=1 Tax=Pedobacter sandarakinus TaxID=353156 RepID=UPI0022481495|nr:ORF6N domain-containing protein [Pedobacter sandarakinus]MCX2575830.1 ORF6N domain-containing protein [Pedobacter sandarakinus]
MQVIKSIQSRIYEIRGERVMLDFDLALLYEVETRVLNQAVKRNNKRFPEDFMFQLTKQEFENLRIEINNVDMSSQIVMTYSSKRPNSALPYAFTEQGVAMLSGVLRSERAINMNIAIMRAFVDVRKILLKQNNLNEQLLEIKERLGEHDVQLNELYDAMDNMLDEKIAQLKWKDRERIGFKIKE